ncbi:MAG: LysR family transcriptional regulator [Solirubrobacteraceae bacterium]
MTLQQLEYFLAAVRLGSFSAAADELHLAQPSLSEQVRRLEAELGVRLFARVGRGLVPTEAGLSLRPHAEAVLGAVAEARESVLAVRELRGGTATFGAWGTARYYPGTDIVAAFRKAHPGVRVRMVGQNSSEVVAAVRAAELEIGMVALPIDDSGLDVTPVMADEIVYASTDPKRLRDDMTIEALARAPLILPDASYGVEDPTRRQLADLAQREGVSIEPEIDVEDVEAALDLTARGLGDTLVARGILLALGRRVPKRVGWVPFAEPLFDTFAFISRTGAVLSPASREFLRLAHERLTALAVQLRDHPKRRMPA